VSLAVKVVIVIGIVILVDTPTTAAFDVAVPRETLRPEVLALAGATDDRTPRPKAATATSATRLKVVFVDICFLSISRSREFPWFGFELIS
jgi:hypothetical protein